MKNSWWPKVGGTVLIVLAGSLALMGTPTYQLPVKHVEDWGRIVASHSDQISPIELGEWIVEKRPGMRIIDVRDAANFTRYAIDGSENIPLAELLTKAGIARLSPKGPHILVSRDGVEAAQAWVVLRGMGYEAYILDGGLEGWVSQVLEGKDVQDPDLAAKVYALKEKFLGNGASVGSAPPPPSPVAVTPVVPTTKKKKSGGC
ncbi:MAG: rhodanese-like domain-containing protein [bacterium]